MVEIGISMMGYRALTAQVSKSDRALALAVGSNDYISKPFREETLFLKMREYLGVEYLYATADGSPVERSVECCGSLATKTNAVDLTQLNTSLTDWSSALKDATICRLRPRTYPTGGSTAPQFSQFRSYLTKLADTYQFKQINDLLDGNPSA